MQLIAQEQRQLLDLCCGAPMRPLRRCVGSGHQQGKTVSLCFSSNLSLDFKATDDLTLSFMGIYNRSYNLSEQRAHVFTSGARSAGLIGDLAFDYTTQVADGTRTANTIAKIGTGVTLTPSFEYRGNYLTVDGNAFFTNSHSHYDPMG